MNNQGYGFIKFQISSGISTRGISSEVTARSTLRLLIWRGYERTRSMIQEHQTLLVFFTKLNSPPGSPSPLLTIRCNCSLLCKLEATLAPLFLPLRFASSLRFRRSSCLFGLSPSLFDLFLSLFCLSRGTACIYYIMQINLLNCYSDCVSGKR